MQRSMLVTNFKGAIESSGRKPEDRKRHLAMVDRQAQIEIAIEFLCELPENLNSIIACLEVRGGQKVCHEILKLRHLGSRAKELVQQGSL